MKLPLIGEPQITDESPCVCAVVRPIAIGLNDYLRDSERQQLTPFVQRAMGSATDNTDEMIRRAWLAEAETAIALLGCTCGGPYRRRTDLSEAIINATGEQA